MKYPDLGGNTPIKEIIFSISYKEIVDKDCFDNFSKLKDISGVFSDIKPSIDQKFKIKGEGGVEILSQANGFHLKNQNEVLQLRKGSFSYHYLSGYKNFDELLNLFSRYWKLFDDVTNDILTITDFSIRYINVIEIDNENQPTHLVQLYPKQSGDRVVTNFQNSVQFSYTESPKYLVNAVSTKINNEGILLDISVSGKTKSNEEALLKELFNPLREIKNKAFFDSITARALIKYINKS